jgi:adenylate cyclase
MYYAHYGSTSFSCRGTQGQALNLLGNPLACGMVRLESQFVFSFPPETVWPALSKTDWINRSLRLPPVNYQILPAPEGGSLVTGSASAFGLKLRWREFPFEWLEPEFYRVHRVFEGGPFREVRLGLELKALPKDRCQAVFYAEWTPRGAAGRGLARFVLGPKSRREIQRIMVHTEEFLGGRKKVVFPELPAQPADESALQTGLQKLAQTGQPPNLIRRLETFLRESPDVELTHIRPLAVARRWDVDPWWVLGLCLRATRCGLLNLSWEVLCPNCRSSRQSPAASLSQIKSVAHCDVCEIKYDAEFDKSVELKFSVNAAVRPVHRQTFCLAGPGGKPHVLSQILLEPGTERTWKWPTLKHALRLHSPQVAASLAVPSADLPGPARRLVITCQADRFVLTDERATAAEATADIRLANPLAYPVLVSWHQLAWSEDILTAGRVTNWQEFRDLFANEVISPNEQVTVGSQVVLFTDLRGSTALYHDMGDARAYRLVRNHFEVLTKVIAAQHGGVVKTIGDAIMAAFSRVDDALEAVRLAFEQLPAANPGLAAPLILKASLHVGPCLAVNANDKLDYFGTAVNLAARMVECCDGGDLTVSDEIFQRPETARFLQSRQPAPKLAEMQFRGFAAPHRVWKIQLQAV